jgi:pimeloyl-ACP methyl ester carboxylesterase
VHGTRTSSAIWAGQVEALSHAGHRGITLDLPGHGDRTGERFTLRGAMRAIDDAVMGCPEPPVLVGLSLGGYLALAYATRHHGAVAGVVLSGCSTEIRGKPLNAYRRLAPHLARVLGRSTGWHVVTEMLDAMRGYSSLADLRRLLVTVWLVNGRNDPLRLEERRFLAASPGARLMVVPRAGHDVNLHAPAAFNRILLGAVRELAVLR